MPAAYYNEFDPFAAQWLRNLIAAGHIADGEVDERSIVEVQADDLRGFTQCHFFAGIGGWSYALRLAGWDDSRPVWTGSCPCQPFSVAGKGEGKEDERHLWPHFFRLIRECRPVACFGEQVASRDALAWLDHVCADLEGAAYTVGAVASPAAGYGAPHIRDRLYWVAEPESQRRQPGQAWSGIDGGGMEPPKCQQGKSAAGGENVGRLGHAASERHGGGGEDGVGFATEMPRQGREAVERLAHDDGRRRGERGERDCDPAQPEQFPSFRHDPHGRGEDGVVGDSKGRGFGIGGDAPFEGSGGHAHGAVEPCGMGDSIGPGSQGFQRSEHLELHRGQGSHGSTATAGFWRDAEWIACRDGKARPVEPGTFPLVAGPSDCMGRVQPRVVKLARRNRVGRLRGYGNGIVAPQAAAFVRAFLEVRP